MQSRDRVKGFILSVPLTFRSSNDHSNSAALDYRLLQSCNGISNRFQIAMLQPLALFDLVCRNSATFKPIKPSKMSATPIQASEGNK